MDPQPIAVLRAAIRQVPAVKYALGIAGIAAAGAIITRLLGYDKASIIIIGVIFIAMILLYAFSGLIASRKTSTTMPGIILLYAVIFFFCTFLFFTVTAFAFQWPSAWAQFIGATPQDFPGPHQVEGDGPVFEPPRMDGRMIDACIRSPQFPEAARLQCIPSAQKLIADAFCKIGHYKHANDDFTSADTVRFQSSWKFVQETVGGRWINRWTEDNTGGFIFTRITCMR
ncbi:hypothetical protein ABIE65_002308 [Constrictibacter sp. MBR-5]|jgi:hypothetical protein|uniref:hypothetical protein n=1 Tax=Constrictibacter sp. MBR-5 TaxID=3156467 RepID=UPI003393B20D